MNKRQRAAERRQIVQDILARNRAKERRRSIIVWGSFGLLAVALVLATVFVVGGEIARRDAVREAASKPIEGVQTFENLGRNHVPNATFSQVPAVGGDHAAQWISCAVYSSPIDEARAVHSLEHGAVWITYQPGLPQAQIDAISAVAKGNPYVLVSPHADQAAPVMATAWGTQLSMQDAGDSRLPAFVKAYANGPQTPEPGASCVGGVQG